MSGVKSGPLVIILGVFALVGFSVALLSPDAPTLAQQVDAYLERLAGEPAPARWQDAPAKIEEGEALLDDAQFSKLPLKKQETLRKHLRALKDYRDYETKLEKIASPKDAKSEDQLAQIQTSLRQWSVPEEYQGEWSQSEAWQRRERAMEDIQALEKAVSEVKKGYLNLNLEVQQLLRQAEEADLPKRARKVLSAASQLPAPANDGDKWIPGSQEVTYATVFRFPAVRAAHAEWEKNREKVKRLSSLGEP